MRSWRSCLFLFYGITLLGSVKSTFELCSVSEYTEITDTVNHIDLGEVLEEQWNISPPEAIIAITGISHQFNIKDKRNLKKDLIEAVKSTGSWIVTCGTESGVVQFIEDAVNDHVALEKIYIPIVGILSKRVLEEIKPLKGAFKVKETNDRIPTKSTKETLDPNHTQFVVLGDSSINLPGDCASSESRNAFQSFLTNIKDADFKTQKYKDEPPKTIPDTGRQYAIYKPKEILPVVLVLIEGGIDAMKTTRSVLGNNNHVVVIDGSGGAASFLSTCYQRATRCKHGKRKSKGKTLTLSKADKDIQSLIDECFENDSKELKEEAKELEKLCLQKQKLIHIYSLKDATTKADELIQNAIFNTYTEYYDKEVANQRGSIYEEDLTINIEKKKLELVEKWKRCDIAEKHIFVVKNRKKLTCLQTLNEKRMHDLKKEMKEVIQEVQKEYEQLPPIYYKRFKKAMSQFKVDNNASNGLVLSQSFGELVAHLPVDHHKALIKEFREIIHHLSDESHVYSYTERALEQTKRITQFQSKIGKIIKEEEQAKIVQSYTEFKKAVLHFIWVKRARYFSILSRSFYKLIEHLPAIFQDEVKQEFQDIETMCVQRHKVDKKMIQALDQKIELIKVDVEKKHEYQLELAEYHDKYKEKLSEYHGKYKEKLSQFMVIYNAKYFMDKIKPNYFMITNKAKYFTNVSKSFANLINSIKDESFVKHEDDFRRILQGCVDEYEKDSVSELFQSSLLANRTDIVMLVMEKIENMSLFVVDNLPNVFRLSIGSKDGLAIQLIQKQWETEFQKEQIDEEIDKQRRIERINAKIKGCDNTIALNKLMARLEKKEKGKKTNRILLAVNNFIIDLFEDPEFKLYDVRAEDVDLIYRDKPFHHLFVWAILVNRREMAMIFWELETDHTCSALFASAVLNELSEKAEFSKHMHLSASLKENARHFEDLAYNVMTQLYSDDRESSLKTLVTKVGRFNSTPLNIAVSQKLKKFMAHTACQAKLNSIWNGDIAEYTPFWRVFVVIFLPFLLIQKIGFITINTKKMPSQQISPSKSRVANPSKNQDTKLHQNRYVDPGENGNANRIEDKLRWIFTRLNCVCQFYSAPVAKFIVYMITYMAFLVIFALFVLTDLYPLSENSPSLLEYLTWVWTLSLAIEEIRQILQTNKGSLLKNLQYWAKDVWNVFDIVMYLLFLLSVVLRCILNSDQFYYARMSYAVTLSMFILRSMHFFIIQRYIGPKVVMIGRMLGDLGFFIALYALFLFSFGIMYQAILFPNSVSSPWQLLKDLVYLPYWQLYGELNLEKIEGEEPTKCTGNPQLYTNGTMERCPIKNQFNALMIAVYLILTNILLVNIIIAIFSQTFQTVQENSGMIYKFHMYALVYEYHDRPMFPLPIVIHLWRIMVFCYYKIRTPTQYGGAFVYDAKPEEIERLHVVEKIAYEIFQNGPYYARSRYDARNMMTDERDINTEIDSTSTQHDIMELREEMQRMRESLIQEIRNQDYRQPDFALDNPRR